MVAKMGIDSTAKLMIGFEVERKHIAAIWDDADHKTHDLGEGWFLTYVYPYNDCRSEDLRFYIYYKQTGKQRPYYQNEQALTHHLTKDISDAQLNFYSLIVRCRELNVILHKNSTDLMVMAVAHVS